MSSNLIGQTLLKQYRVDSFLAAGGMGAVYRVWDTKRQVPLAMKVLHADLADDPSILKRFKREANALKKLTHPHIVPFYGLHQSGKLAFLLTQYVDGPSLKDVLRERKGKPLPVEEALVYLKAVSAALGYAHAHDVVHCDVKPGNVMVDRGGQVYLADFGIARHAESTTTTLGFAGTAAYMAPEQVRGEAVSPRTDVYALGVMLYEMVSGVRPFRGDEQETESTGGTAAERIRHAHLYLAPPDPRQHNPALSEELAQVILKALAKDPAERFESARALYEAACASESLNPQAVPDHHFEPGATTLARPIWREPQVKYAQPGDGKIFVTPVGLTIGGIIVVAILLGIFALGGRSSSTLSTNPTYPRGEEPSGEVQSLDDEGSSRIAVIIVTATEQPPSRSLEIAEEPSATLTPIPTDTPAPTPEPRERTAEEYYPLPNCAKSRLYVGDRAYVSYGGRPTGFGASLTRIQEGTLLATRNKARVLTS